MADNTLSCQRETLHSQQLKSIKKSIDSDHGIYRFKDEPQYHRGDSKGNRTKPQLNQYAPRSSLRRLWRSVQRQRTSPDAGESKHADCGKNRSDRSGRRVPWWSI